MSNLKMYILVGPKKIKTNEKEYTWEPKKVLNFWYMYVYANWGYGIYITDYDILKEFGWKLPEEIRIRGNIKIWNASRKSLLLEIPYWKIEKKTRKYRERKILHARPNEIGYWIVSKTSKAQKIDIKSKLGKAIFKNATGLDFKKRNKEV